jgi:microcystin degradation protein MlrC
MEIFQSCKLVDLLLDQLALTNKPVFQGFFNLLLFLFHQLFRVSKTCNDDETIQGLYKQVEENEKQIEDMRKNLPVNIG